jgi:hypothetical protein
VLIDTPFDNWKHHKEKLEKHSQRKYHQDAVVSADIYIHEVANFSAQVDMYIAIIYLL